MYSATPYIHTIGPATSEMEVGYDVQSGVQYKSQMGEHAFWAATVPFVPSMRSDDFVRLGQQRVAIAAQRQFRFLYDLARARDHQSTFELRYISTPHPVHSSLPNRIDIVYIGKVFASRQSAGRQLAEQQWTKFSSNYPLEDPYNYPLRPITDPAEFQELFEPIPIADIQLEDVFEIRKFEDMPIQNQAALARVQLKRDYIAHPFVPNSDFTPMGRFLEALAAIPVKAYASISIRPTRLHAQEVHNISSLIGYFRDEIMREDDVRDEYIRNRAQIGIEVYEQLMREREQLLLVRVHVVGEQILGGNNELRGVGEALGSEMMGNTQSGYPTQWNLIQPHTPEQFQDAIRNLHLLEHKPWGMTLAAPQLARLRYLSTTIETYGAFRLPVPAESGYLPGVLVKEEPFVAPADDLEQRLLTGGKSQATVRDARISLGYIYHRGNRREQEFTVSLRDLTRHTLIAGSTGSGKSTTIKHIVSQLWGKHKIPFLVLYPIDKPDYRELLEIPSIAEELLVFTLGDESTVPFRFNPFEVPQGQLLKTHVSRLMRVFEAAFSLPDPLPMVYREALRKVYRQHGWDLARDRGSNEHSYPIMSEFYAAIKAVAESLDYAGETKATVQQASVIRIGDLLENAGHTVNVRQSMSFAKILERPTVMEIGRVGSMQDTALLMGFLLMRFAAEVERNPRPLNRPHITIVEEAHRLMAGESGSNTDNNSQGATGEDFSNILAEVRGFGEGLMIAEQIPAMLVRGAIGNTNLKIMHFLEDRPSFEMFTEILNLDDTQRKYVRSLTPGFAVVRSPYGRPVHIKIPRSETPAQTVDTSDAGLRAIMQSRVASLSAQPITVEPWELKKNGDDKRTFSKETEAALRVLTRAPHKTCAFCIPLHVEQKCPHRKAVEALLLKNDQSSIQLQAKLTATVGVDEIEARATGLANLKQDEQLQSTDRLYCLMAHKSLENMPFSVDKTSRSKYKRGLRELHQLLGDA